ncbi:calmodulin-regulated spectrin-associated protein patronin isoform X5 [Rhodnius prolixus]|uniref:calmodulin-regulated spectrin-associated protein patronin isoform X5 n=1 Tax=Rhodnius prolixus TaxID=13249 RepID=UPI003D18E41A
MWGAISRLFHKQNGTNRNSNEELIMDKGEPRKFQESEPETYGTRQAKQRATVKWLLSKAFNNRIPENLLEPFYRNHEDQELLKPQLVHWLANAELYCMALSNIYSDPNYHNLNHCGVLQALSRKGVYISDPHITETVLIQTTPIKLSAHQTVMQAVMTLYAKEVATPEFVYAAVKRFMPSCAADEEPSPTDYEHALLFWINHATSALRLRVEQEERTSNVKCPEFPKVSSLQDLCDGVSLCGLVSFYCPEELPWSSISVSQVPTVSDCVRNLTLVHDFCARALPAGIFHMSPEDVYYMRGSMKHNLVVFLADLFNMLEIHPAPCVTLNSSSTKATINAEGRNSQGVAHKRSLPQTVSAIPDLRSSLDTPSSFSGSPILSAGHLKKPHVNSQNENCVERNEEDEFVVHRGRSVPTLSSVTGSASDGNRQAEHNDRVAGKPSNWEPRKQSFAGRRSRRNSLSDESQLTLENFGGSQENLHLLGRNPDKEPAVLHSGRRDSQVARSSVLDNNSDALTCALQDTYAKQQAGEDIDSGNVRRGLSRNNSFSESQRRADQTRSSAGVQETLQEPTPPQSPTIQSNVSGFEASPRIVSLSRRNSLIESQRRADQTRSSAGIQETLLEPEVNTNAATKNASEVSIQRVSLSRTNSFTESQRRADQTRSSAGIQQMLLDPSPQQTPTHHNECRSQDKEKKVTSFAALPNNTTTWQQQSKANQNSEQLHDSVANDVVDNGIMGSQLMNIRMKLEEKRRRIESEKRRMEAQLNRQRQKVGKAAFLQAVSKAKVVKSPESDPGRETTTTSEHSKENKPPRPFSLQDITEVEQKWLSGDGFTEERKTPDMDNMDIETYQQSIAQMNSSLHEIQADLQRLANQQNQLQNNQIGQPLNQGNMGMPQVLQPQQQSQQPPQMQSFASLHQQAGYTTQHINFNSQPPQQQQQQQQYPMQQQQHYQLQSQQAPPPQQPPQPPQQQHEYFNGRLATFNTGHTQQQMQQMHSLMSAASNTGQQHYNTQQWHSLSQQSPQPPQQQPQQQQPNYNTYSSRYNQGFQLHNYEDSYHHRHDPAPPPPPPSHHTQPPSTQGEFYLHDPPTVQQRRTWGQPYSPSADSGWSGSGGSAKREPVSLGSSPKQPHYLMHNGGGGRTSPPTGVPTPPPRSSVNHAPLPTPPVDDMEPQSISFIGSGDDDPHLTTGLSKLNITSGSRTYRIPSPTRAYTPSVRNSFSQQHDKPEQGFYISFDDPSSQPKRPKPPLRTKRNSPKKERGLTQTLDGSSLGKTCEETQNGQQTHSSVGSPMTERPIVRSSSIASQECSPAPPPRNRESISESRVPHIPVEEPIVIGAQPDPGTLDEMEKKKERILMLSLQRRQAAEEARTLKEAEAARRRDQEKAREEEKLRKKEEEKRRRAVILEQYKIKKVIEEAEREGKQVDKELLHSLKMGLSSASGSSTSGGSSSGGPKMRSKTGQGRPRPKTIHIDSGADSHPGTITPSRDKKGSSSNLSVFSTGSSTMRRDYYRGSQDCLVETRKPSSARLYSEIGDESRGTSPGRSLGRRSSYKTSRGSSCDQDSLVYRYGDTDSGLGRATPPRRVPSPSGPGSLPATHHRRLQPGMGRYDVADNVSDAGSDYTGPRLYRQPATKSNKGIVLNAVEYCVFPGAVNKEAKQRVIEEMNRSEAKHFLVLFRDAGCQFRALYAYYPETEEVVKLYGTGPKQVSDRMFDKFFKYNSGGKCFSQVHTKHLTVTIDAFTIHNSLWQGKKVNLPNKRDMTLVI